MVANLAVPPPAQYGAVDLKQFYQRRWFYGFFIAVLFHITVICVYYLARSPLDTVQGSGPHVPVISVLPAPPPIGVLPLPPQMVPKGVENSSEGIPEPVALADPASTIPRQFEYGTGSEEGIEGVGTGELPPEEIIIEEPPPDFVYTEENPVIIHRVNPRYPELAVGAGLEGNVFLKIWVDKEGMPRQVVVLKSDSEIFNQAAITAAGQLRFRPAYTAAGPVSVWVSMPFRFRLTDAR